MKAFTAYDRYVEIVGFISVGIASNREPACAVLIEQLRLTSIPPRRVV